MDIWSTPRDARSQMMLRDNLHSEMILLHGDVGTTAHCLHQPALDLGSCVVLMMQYAELRVSALTMQVKLSIVLLVEVDAPVNHLLNLSGSIPHHLLHSPTVADEVSGNHRVLDMLVEVIKL